MSYKPRVSIGLPVYNGENFIADQIESILNQTFTDFELIISDNASTDGTEKICRYYANRDKRVKYFRNSENLGAARNYNHTFELSSGEYFKWAAHDDKMDPEYLETCVNVLDNQPNIVLCHTEVKIIDGNGDLVEEYQSPLNHINSLSPHVRYGDMLLKQHHWHEVFGVARAEVMGKTNLHGNHLGADGNFLGEMALRGRIFVHPGYLYYMRDHPERSIRATDRKSHSRAVWFDPRNKGKRMYEHPRFFLECAKSIQRVPLSMPERISAYEQLFKWAWMKRLNFMYDIYTVNPYLYDMYKVYAKLKRLWKRGAESEVNQTESMMHKA